jgi:hypothetical protein
MFAFKKFTFQCFTVCCILDVMLEDIETMFRCRGTHRAHLISSSSASSSLSNTGQTNVLGNFSSSCSCLLPPWQYYPEAINQSATSTFTHNILTPAKNFKDIHVDGYAGSDQEFYEPTSLHKYSREMRETDFYYLNYSNASSGNKLSLLEKKSNSKNRAPSSYTSYGSVVGVSHNSSLESTMHGDSVSDNANGPSYRSTGFYQADLFNREETYEGIHEERSDKVYASSFDASWPFQDHDKKKSGGNNVRKN